MILFRPVGLPPEILAFNGTRMSQPLTSNPDALNSPKVYFIFVGPNWQHNGNPTAAVNSMIADAKAILNSSYLDGLKQYGSNGSAVFGDFTIDTSLDPLTWSKDYTRPDGTIEHTNNPVWFETDQILSNPKFASWNPPPGDARTSPIYVVARYSNDGTGVGGGYGGSNNFGPNYYTTRAVNVIDVAITSADQVDEFSWVFSHEIVERMSSGIGGLSDSAGQIADGEPEGSDYYAWRLNGSSSPVVTSYWSFLDQAFIVPDGKLERVLLVPIWSGGSWTSKCLTLEQGNLYEVSPPGTTTLIDTQVQSYVINSHGGTARIFDLTAKGQVKEYTGSGTSWTSVTGSNTVASELVTTSDGNLYMLASNDGGPTQVWQYLFSGSNWAAVTGTNTKVQSIAAAGSGLYMLASNVGGNPEVWQYGGSGANWAAIIGTNTYPYAIVAVAGSIYMMASNDGGPNGVWLYGGSGNNWTPVTGPNTTVYSIAAAGDVLCMVAANAGSGTGVWQYGLSPRSWISLTGPNTDPNQIVVQDGIDLYMVAANDAAARQVWQYDGTPSSWTALTGTNTKVDSINVATDNHLYMIAANNGGAFQNWKYDGTPYDWTVV